MADGRDMVERVARALSKVPVRDMADPGGELDGLRLREAARAAIEAMREPTEDMYDGLNASTSFAYYMHFAEFKYCYGKTIDAALASPTPSSPDSVETLVE